MAKDTELSIDYGWEAVYVICFCTCVCTYIRVDMHKIAVTHMCIYTHFINIHTHPQSTNQPTDSYGRKKTKCLCGCAGCRGFIEKDDTVALQAEETWSQIRGVVGTWRANRRYVFCVRRTCFVFFYLLFFVWRRAWGWTDAFSPRTIHMRTRTYTSSHRPPTRPHNTKQRTGRRASLGRRWWGRRCGSSTRTRSSTSR